MYVLAAVFILGLSVVGVALAWRVASRYQALPCPSWMVPLLENPYVNSLAGAGTLLQRATVRPGMSVLDVGCGPGRLSLPAAELVGPAGSVMAVDLQPDMLQRLKDRLTQRDLKNVTTLQASVGEGKLPRDHFDRAFLVAVLGEIVDKERAIAEIHDALKPGGLLSVTEVFPDPHYRRRTTVRSLAEHAYFRLDGTFGNWLAYTLNFKKENAP